LRHSLCEDSASPAPGGQDSPPTCTNVGRAENLRPAFFTALRPEVQEDTKTGGGAVIAAVNASTPRCPCGPAPGAQVQTPTFTDGGRAEILRQAVFTAPFLRAGDTNRGRAIVSRLCGTTAIRHPPRCQLVPLPLKTLAAPKPCALLPPAP
jgi:hypothetical protein